jgi:hypothetical protein
MLVGKHCIYVSLEQPQKQSVPARMVVLALSIILSYEIFLTVPGPYRTSTEHAYISTSCSMLSASYLPSGNPTIHGGLARLEPIFDPPDGSTLPDCNPLLLCTR